MGKYVSEEIKQAVLEDIKNGLKVSEAAVKHGVLASYYGRTTNPLLGSWREPRTPSSNMLSLKQALKSE